MVDIDIDEAFLEKLKTGLKTKEQHFGNNIFFYGPGFKHYEVEDFKTVSKPRFVDISITSKTSLHSNSRYKTNSSMQKPKNE